MKFLTFMIFAAAIAVLQHAGAIAADVASPNGRWQQFTQEYCIKCHGPEKPKGKLRLDVLAFGTVNDENYPAWKHVISQLEKGEMPPEDSNHLPLKSESSAIVSLVSNTLQGGGNDQGD